MTEFSYEEMCEMYEALRMFKHSGTESWIHSWSGRTFFKDSKKWIYFEEMDFEYGWDENGN